jgi:hypothetical protein
MHWVGSHGHLTGSDPSVGGIEWSACYKILQKDNIKMGLKKYVVGGHVLDSSGLGSG